MAPPLPDAWALSERTGLPDTLRVLVEAVPRELWKRHENFSGMVQFWMQRHLMFRQLTRDLAADADACVAGTLQFQDYAPRLVDLGGTLLNELHMHHQIEDQHYFPQLVALDARIETGFDLLERDHEAMDGLLHGIAQGANAVLTGGEIGGFRDDLAAFTALLQRHLTDEEEIVVPVILLNGFEG